jgi:hypothetical protein
MTPPPPVDYLRWAEDNIVFTERESPLPGPYNRDLFYYFDEILRALSPDDPCRIVSVHGSAQLGKTVLANIFCGGSLAMDPAISSTSIRPRTTPQRWSKMKLVPMLKGTTALRALFPMKARDGLRFGALQGTHRRQGRHPDFRRQLAGVALPGDDEAPGAGRPGQVGDEQRRRPGDAGRQPQPGA